MNDSLVPLLSIVLCTFLLILPPAWRIFKRTGLGGPWSLVVLVPGAGSFIAILILAFAEWPSAQPPRARRGAL